MTMSSEEVAFDAAAPGSPPPSYSQLFPFGLSDSLDVQDGRIDIQLDSKITELFSRFVPPPFEENGALGEGIRSGHYDSEWTIPLNIVIQVVGSRGDVQPFIALGNELQRHGHRIRLATHGCFEQFVRQAGLEFYSIGGDPVELMAYMVKNPGLVPGMRTLRQGEIQRKRAMIAEMLEGCWMACIEPDQQSSTPFVAQAIIANPVSFAHVHCAELLSIPVHLMFTMPWTNTRSFPHPLANIRTSDHEPRLMNYISYSVVDWMTWQGIGGVINTWRTSRGLAPVPTSEGPFLASTLKIPHTYCWSPALIPKPVDWPNHIDVCGFFFRKIPAYTPPPELTNFLSSGPVPIYIGFGSIVIEDPTRVTKILREAVERSGVRAIISRGWSKIGEASSSGNIFYLDDCPHEWLFQRVSVVVHHGGAGTTACGLLNARPTVIVPFFGDQPFWGKMVANSEAGSEPIPHKRLTVDNLAAAIALCLTPKVVRAASEIACKMQQEDGVSHAVASFHRHLSRESMGCELVQCQPATWLCTGSKVPLRLSTVAVEGLRLARDVKFKPKHFKHYGPSPILIKNRRWDPITSASSAGFRMASDITTSTIGMISDPAKVYLTKSKTTSDEVNPPNIHGQAALAFARNLDQLALGTFKAGMVDVPLALAEGFRNTPRLWGETVPEQDAVTGWKSGCAVAGKSLAHGFYDGVGGLFYKPYQGARDEGALGFAKGCGKGLVGTVTGPVSGAFGVFGYTGTGIAKSLDRNIHRGTMKRILAAKRAEADYLTRSRHAEVIDRKIVEGFLRRKLSS